MLLNSQITNYKNSGLHQKIRLQHHQVNCQEHIDGYKT